MKRLLLLSFLTAGLAGMAAGQVNLSNGLQAYYFFNGNAADSSGNNRHGMVHGATLTTDRWGVPGRAYKFVGANHDYINAAIPTIPIGSNDRTLNAWIKWSGTPFINAAHAVNWGTSATGQLFGAGVYLNNKWYTFGYDNGAGYDLNSTITADTAWHMVTSVYEGGVMKMYIDGILGATNTKLLNTGFTDLFIGTRPDFAADSYFTGAVDEVRLYNRALSVAEITSLHNLPNTAAPSVQLAGGTVSPNPATRYVDVSFAVPGMTGEVYDASGRLVRQFVFSSRRLDISDLPAGNQYFLKVSGATGSFTFLKQ